MNWHRVDWTKPDSEIARHLGVATITVKGMRSKYRKAASRHEDSAHPMPLATFPSLPQAEAKRILQSVEAGEITREEGHQRIRNLRGQR